MKARMSMSAGRNGRETEISWKKLFANVRMLRMYAENAKAASALIDAQGKFRSSGRFSSCPFSEWTSAMLVGSEPQGEQYIHALGSSALRWPMADGLDEA